METNEIIKEDSTNTYISFGFINKDIVISEYLDCYAITNLNNINKEYLEKSKQILIEDLILEKKAYKDRNNIDSGGYTKDAIDRALKVIKTFYHIKKDTKIYGYLSVNMPIVITLENDITSKNMAIVIAPRVIN